VRRGEVLVIFRIGDKGQIASLRLLNAGHATNLELAVAFQPAFQPFS
jgi:hypothetical protein